MWKYNKNAVLLSIMKHVATRIIGSLNSATVGHIPYRRWYLRQVLPPETCQDVIDLPFEPPRIGDTRGKRETHNSTRRFFDTEANAQFSVCREVADAFQSGPVVQAVQRICGVDLDGSYLRIEYCLDTEGFWLAPHTDLGVKLFTLLMYLSTDPGHERWGTDVFADADTLAETVPAVFNSALVFVPAHNTWHGFHPRPINGLRRSLIVNYVTDQWRARHELAFPERPIGS